MLGTVASFAQILSAIAVGAAVVFAFLQVRQFRQQRRDLAGVELMRTMQNRELVEAWDRVVSVDRSVSTADARAMGPEYERAAHSLVAVYEALGLLVFRGIVPFDLVRESTSGPFAAAWEALHVWVEEVRVRRSDERYGEWFQWLAERLQQFNEKASLEPAHKRFAAWRPRE
jgi:hypothetical protein